MRSAFLLAVVVLVLGLAMADTERNEAQAQHDHYCDMVQIYKDSQGEYGWPNYENRECSND